MAPFGRVVIERLRTSLRTGTPDRSFQQRVESEIATNRVVFGRLPNDLNATPFQLIKNGEVRLFGVTEVEVWLSF